MQGITGQNKLQFPLEFINWEKKASMPESNDVFRTSSVIVDGKVYFVIVILYWSTAPIPTCGR